MVKTIKPRQRRIIKAKIKGASNKDIGAQEYPNATPASQAVLVSRQLKKPNVAQYYEQSKLQALKEHNITWSRIIRPINDALEAVNGKGDVDHNVRLSATKQARELLDLKVKDRDDDAPPLTEIPADWDEVQMARFIKNKH